MTAGCVFVWGAANEFLRTSLDWDRLDMDEDVGATCKSADLRVHVYLAVSTCSCGGSWSLSRRDGDSK